MVCKRPYGEDGLINVGYKFPRQMEYSYQPTSVVEFPLYNDVCREPHTLGDLNFIKSQSEERRSSNRISEHPLDGCKEFECVTDGFDGKDLKAEVAAQVDQFPGLEAGESTRSVDQPEEIESYFSDYESRKPVSVGPNFQVDIPVWGVKGINSSSDCLNASNPNSAIPNCHDTISVVYKDNSEQLMGCCVIPMPGSDMLPYNEDKVEDSRADCYCLDEGSIRCVRQHIAESRERLRNTIGQKAFVELGFYEMGEVVSRRWSEEEEQVFHDIIFTNSASSGKNFWDHLSVVFPTRTKKEIVSYYFNVFMLRKRAEQNRLDPMNIDSDNDDWQGSDEGDDEFGMTEEDEDSVVESPQENNICDNEPGEHIHEEDESGDEIYCKEGDDDAGEANVSYDQAGNLLDDYCFRSGVQLSSKNSQDSGEDNDVRDESCMSYESQLSRADDSSLPLDVDVGNRVTSQDSPVENDDGGYLQCSYDELSRSEENAHTLGSCDVKVWDFGYYGSLKKDVDFFPTFNMIEDLFGEETWTDNGSDGNDIS